MDFFRGHSAVIVVALVSSLVVVGNLNKAEDNTNNTGFVSGFFQKEESNEEKIKRRVKNNVYKNETAMVPVAVATEEIKDEESIAELLNKEGNLNQNQAQYQVLTATIPDTKELLDQGADVAVYQVKSGDTLGSIAQKFEVTENTILWANDIDDPDLIMPDDKIFILPAVGVQHVVKDGDTIDKIAKKYEAEKDRIIAFNELPADGRLKVGEELIIPDGQKEDPRPATPRSLLTQRNYYSSGDSGTRTPSIIDRNPKRGHRFPGGQCTWYVAQSKYVPWGGNAGTWLYNSRAFGAKTGKKAKKGAIMVTSESWYGHVGIVTKVKGGNVTIREMNYRGPWIENTRTLSAKSRVIKGYIY
ncbi:LysM peptidoglycan-binding domain-containing protein [bacterium]|nr:LysM peptidoglycan-binding domain-containing protein [bacterium]MBT4251576.1 LysM peptidoglycan-binding domain-containing protein [bacterium]MBT4597625.1 LysM peptidoglycan-binding domain-containing protein [bacterium]MBT6753639.1 LysM peptidoglycan-binding domain-containing protein [bacterium]MBT7431329.1 LysM peptidoglycan-binding domain-containing protein [bacterium]